MASVEPSGTANAAVGAGRHAAGRPAVRRLRTAVQLAVFAVTLWGGLDLYRFTLLLEQGRVPPFAKPLSPEGFLPIGSLMSFKLWATTGIVDRVHPAGLFIFAGALALSLALKKSFCGWICPVGTLSEWAWKLREAAGGRMRRAPRWLDLPLRSLKYLLLAFFVWVVVVRMPTAAIRVWLDTDYWKIADLKMLNFFRQPSALAAGVLAALVALSLVTKGFWCRYLCPYGALLGLASLASPAKVRRDAARCIGCGRCARHCPALLPVDRLGTVRSAECLGCLTCVSRCPAPGALDAALPGRQVVPPRLWAALVVGVFFGIIAVAKFSGHWEAGVSPAEYLRIVPTLGVLAHP